MEERILNESEKILPEGFVLKVTKSLDTKMISFVKEQKNVIYTIQNSTINDRIYDNFLGNILAKIIFKDIELILNPKYEVGNNNPTINYKGHQFLFDIPKNESIYSHLPLLYKNEQDLDKACKLISKYIKEVAEPFFAYWQDIRSFLPFLETNDSMFLSDMFCGDSLFKKIIIWKLCSHPKYEQFRDSKLSLIESKLPEKSKDKIYLKNYNRMLSILKRLEKTTPLYKWDERYLEIKPFEGEINFLKLGKDF